MSIKYTKPRTKQPELYSNTVIQTAALYYFNTKFDGFLRILYCVLYIFFIYVLNSDFISDCNLHTKILHSVMAEVTLDVK
jgi:hypothetical protein